jgi:hypothetical protein
LESQSLCYIIEAAIEIPSSVREGEGPTPTTADRTDARAQGCKFSALSPNLTFTSPGVQRMLAQRTIFVLRKGLIRGRTEGSELNIHVLSYHNITTSFDDRFSPVRYHGDTCWPLADRLFFSCKHACSTLFQPRPVSCHGT